MVAVISKMQANSPTRWQPFANKTGKLNNFGSGKKFKSTTGHVRPGMSLSRLPRPVGRDILVQYYPWFIHWFLVNYNGERAT